MEILDQTDENQATFMRDILRDLIKEDINIWAGQTYFCGQLISYNGSIVHLYSKVDKQNYYIQSSEIIAVKAAK